MADGSPGARRPEGAGAWILWTGLGALAGAALAPGVWGLLSGGLLGALWAGTRRAESRADVLEATLRDVARRLRELEAGPRGDRALPAEPAERPPAGAALPHEPRVAPPSAAAPPSIPPLSPPAAPPHLPPAPPPLPPPRPAAVRPSILERALAAARDLLLGGNTVVRVGVLVLLVGVLLLAKWAADAQLFPLEARLAVAALIGLALVVVGYRVRDARPGFGTTLQGGGIAALYLVVFVALRLFSLLPPSLAFYLFVTIAAAGGALAVLQHAQPLIFIGSLGGYLAPVLASTGEGSHVVLFGYYLVLNAAVAAASWFRAWRALHLLAFFSTYGIAAAWGVLRYRPEHFATTEPFVVAYLALFTAIAVVFAWRRPPRLAGLVDGTLVFGTALVTLLAQARLVEGRTFGMAWSSAGLGLFYAVLGTWLWRRAPDTLRRLCEAFVALAVGFGTLAIPFALDDGLTTTLAWALEGAGLYWVGARQARPWVRLAGVALQGLAAAAFVVGLDTGMGGPPEFAERIFANARFFACAGLAFAGGFVAREAWAVRERLEPRESQLLQGLAVWALLWWVGGAVADVDEFLASRHELPAIVGFTAVSAVGQAWLAERLAWLPGRLLALWCLPAGFLWLAAGLGARPHLLAHGGVLAWPALVAGLYWILARVEGCGVAWARTAHAPAFLLAALAPSVALAGWVERSLQLHGDWPASSFGLGLAVALLAGRRAVEAGLGPFGRCSRVYLRIGLPLVVAVALLWTVALAFSARGDAEPLPYVPLLGPADLVTALVFVAVLAWWQRLGRAEPDARASAPHRHVPAVVGALAFLWLNAFLARTVHQWTGVPLDPDDLWDSIPFQASVSIAWALVALAGMWTSTRRGARSAWITFATLIGVVVVKLFVVDLSQLSTPAKIGTFLAVGALLLVVGWISPVPPGGGDAPRPGDAA